MSRSADFHAFEFETDLLDPTFPNLFRRAPYGRLHARYVVTAVDDVRNLQSQRVYSVTCFHKIEILGINGEGFSLDAPVAFENYPVAMTLLAEPNIARDNDAHVRITNYFPKTLNAALSTSSSTTAGEGKSTGTQQTTGSSTARTNSYDVSVTAGMSGWTPQGSVTGTAGHSGTDTSEESRAQSSDQSSNVDIGQSYNMSMKDWAAVGQMLPGKRVCWTWAQEFPWNVFMYRANGDVTLPPEVLGRLKTEKGVLPPSELALYGFEFSSSVTWLYAPSVDSSADEEVSLSYSVNLLQASHGHLDDDPFQSTMRAVPGMVTQSPYFNLPLLALRRLDDNGVENGAAVSFTQFLCPPDNAGAFRAVSSRNNLYVTGTGFDDVIPAVAPLSTDFARGEVIVRIYFKISSEADNMTLFLKHWTGSKAGCVVSGVINGQSESFSRSVDAQMLSGGSDNIAAIDLRSTDHAQGEYYDYLIPGLNTVELKIRPLDATTETHYVLRAIAVG